MAHKILAIINSLLSTHARPVGRSSGGLTEELKLAVGNVETSAVFPADSVSDAESGRARCTHDREQNVYETESHIDTAIRNRIGQQCLKKINERKEKTNVVRLIKCVPDFSDHFTNVWPRQKQLVIQNRKNTNKR